MAVSEPRAKRQRISRRDAQGATANEKDGSKNGSNEASKRKSALLQDDRISWLVKDDDSNVDIVAGPEGQEETLSVRRSILVKNSEYFRGALASPCIEAREKRIKFTDIEPKYLALFVSVAYSHCGLVPVTPPQSSTGWDDFEGTTKTPSPPLTKNTIEEYAEVLNLCDRFICPEMSKTVEKCVLREMHEGHKTMFRHGEIAKEVQVDQLEAFADGYEAILRLPLTLSGRLGERLIDLLSASLKYGCWDAEMVLKLEDRPKFVSAVSVAMAAKLKHLEEVRKFKRRELKF